MVQYDYCELRLAALEMTVKGRRVNNEERKWVKPEGDITQACSLLSVISNGTK